jgi:hypothetical protein
MHVSCFVHDEPTSFVFTSHLLEYAKRELANQSIMHACMYITVYACTYAYFLLSLLLST